MELEKNNMEFWGKIHIIKWISYGLKIYILWNLIILLNCRIQKKLKGGGGDVGKIIWKNHLQNLGKNRFHRS